MRHHGHVLLPMPNGKTARIAIEDEIFDIDEAKDFQAKAWQNGHHNILDLIRDLKNQGLSLPQAVSVICGYMDALKQEKLR